MKSIRVGLNFSDVPIPKVPSFGGIGDGIKDKLLTEAVNKMIEKAGLPEGFDVNTEIQGDDVSATLKIPLEFLEKISQSGKITITSVELAD